MAAIVRGVDVSDGGVSEGGNDGARKTKEIYSNAENDETNGTAKYVQRQWWYRTLMLVVPVRWFYTWVHLGCSTQRVIYERSPDFLIHD